MATVPGVRFLPNAITVLAVSSGLTAVAFALQTSLPHHFTYSIGAIAAAAILDSLDGPAARLLRSQSRVGAELDSLSDAISFGVAPALLLYIWMLQGQPLGWVACLVYAVCTVLRLARFNSLLDTAPKPWAKGFFTGVPSPAGALLATMPLLADIRFGSGFWTEPWVVGVWAILMGFLMVSRLPTIALKSVRVAPKLIVPMLVLLVVGVAALFYEPHLILLLGLVVYLLHLPYAAWKYQHLRRHPELWDSNARREVARAARRLRRSSRLRVHRRVAGRASDGTPLPRQRRLGRLRSVRVPRRKR
ncbi:MAG: CDP-diacylglycerol--serine O-phosphatidyltransferase [Actinobacteria bacterium 69-20]|jgi:CDP-diacylglycerol--serine O-phosphatidyltransferase|nr:CDP-diacylglycerol--serine O-phosphatidyltransferase [Actinomycetota bacterium]OJV23519.1 MAG: CDP-diacylglycerol--serine O-phosphatidyltransferase [Actinobacteria bacterium 69-20]